jgi:cardiolipin synthase
MVHLLVDGFGSKEMFRKTREMLVAAQVQVLIYRPKISPLTLRRNRLRRLHRKLVVVDGRVAFIGGINIIDDMDTPGLIPPRYDYAVRIEGPLLTAMVREVTRLWNRLAWINLRWQWRSPPSTPGDAPCPGGQRAALVVRDNILHRRDIEEAYLAAIHQAQSEIIIANAYFLPGQRFRQALLRAAGRGVRVVLLLQGRQEYLLLYLATRALYGQFLDAGIVIAEYHKSFMHAKVAVIDQRWATVGSSNIDPFSLLLAREANVIIDDHGFAHELRTSLQRHMEDGATVVAKTQWYRLPLWRRLVIWIAYGLVRLLTGLAGYDGRY